MDREIHDRLEKDRSEEEEALDQTVVVTGVPVVPKTDWNLHTFSFLCFRVLSLTPKQKQNKAKQSQKKIEKWNDEKEETIQERSDCFVFFLSYFPPFIVEWMDERMDELNNRKRKERKQKR